MIQYMVDGAVDAAYRDTRLIALLKKKASTLNTTPTLPVGSPGPHHVLLVMITQLHWNDVQLRATRKTTASVFQSKLSDFISGVFDAEVEALSMYLLQPGLITSPFDPDYDESIESKEMEHRESLRPAHDLERVLEASLSTLEGVNGCLWLRTWVGRDGALQADVTLSVEYDPYEDENYHTWCRLKSMIHGVFQSHGIRHHYVDIQVLSDRRPGGRKSSQRGRGHAGNLMEGYDLVLQDVESQVKKIQGAWRRYQLRRTIVNRIQQLGDGTYDSDTMILVVQKAVIIQSWWRKIMGELKEARMEILIQKWTSTGENESLQPMWYDRLRSFPLFIQAPELLEKIVSELDWEIMDPGVPILQKGQPAKELYWLIDGRVSVLPQPFLELDEPQAGLLNAVSHGLHPFDVNVEELSFVVRLKQRYWDRALSDLPHMATYIEDYGVPVPFYLQRHGNMMHELSAAEYRLWIQLDSCEEHWERMHVARQWVDKAYTIKALCNLTAWYSPVLCLAARTGDSDLLTYFVDLGAEIDREAQDRSLRMIALQNGQDQFATWMQEHLPGT